MKHVLTAKQFTRQELTDLFFKTNKLYKASPNCSTRDVLRHKTVATLFYEPSTRTRLSFEAAVYKLGGNVISTENASQFSSAIKGESLEDTVQVTSRYVDGIVLRHPERLSAQRAAEVSSVPVFNAGDGAGEHPTQALLDLYTIQKEKGFIDGLRIALVGDLKYGRTVHSLVYLLGLYERIEFILISPLNLRMPKEQMDFIKNKGFKVTEVASLPLGMELNPIVVYMTRVQKERMEANEGVDESCVFGPNELKMLSPSGIIMHPLPRCEEIDREVDKDDRAAYFRQAGNGLWVRAALLAQYLGA